MANQPSNMRSADVAVAHSETKLTGFRLISQGQVRIWKAMLVGVFFAGFVGALTFVVGYDAAPKPEQSRAAAGVAPLRQDYAVTDFNPPLTGTVSVPITLSATVQSIEGMQGNVSFYFIKDYTDQSNIVQKFQLPGCAWEQVAVQPNERKTFSCQWIPERATAEKVTAYLTPVRGEAFIDNNAVERSITIAPFMGAQYYENFEAYPALGDPTSWVDTKSGNSLVVDDSLFKTVPVGGSMTLATMSDTAPGGIHSHYVKDDSSRWSNYTVTGSMFFNQVYSGIGVTFYSQFPKAKKYYSLYGSALGAPPGPQGPFFSLQALGSSLSGDTVVETGALRNTWYRFKVMVASDKVRTTIRAKMWKEGDPEPSGWQADAYDQSRTRISQGTVGVKKGFPRGGKWDKLMVEQNNPTVIPTADFSLDLSPQNLAVPQGEVARFTLNALPSGGFSGVVGGWRVESCPGPAVADGATNCSVKPSSCVVGTGKFGPCATLEISTRGLPLAGSAFGIGVTGVSGELTRTSNRVTLSLSQPVSLEVTGITIAKVSATSATIEWRTNNEQALRVAYSVNEITSLPSTTVGSTLVKREGDLYVYQATISRLKPRTRYFYRVYNPPPDYTSEVKFYDAEFSYLRMFGTQAEVADYTRRIAYWSGKVNQHMENGAWKTDADGTSGADLDKLAYCKKFYPATTRVEDSRYETIFDWKEQGNLHSHVGTHMTYRCVDATQRIAYWWGKVNQHIDEKGNWVTDPDGKSGANINKLKYCQKWYPNTVSVKSYLMETIFDWKAAGNRGSYPKNVTSDQCVQGVGLFQGSP